MFRRRAWIVGGLTIAMAACAPEGASSDTKAQIIKPDGADVSLPLTELAKLPVPEVLRFRAREAEQVRPIPHMHGQAAAQQQDPVVQNAFGTGPNISTPTATFEGQGVGLPGFTVQSAPPDPDGDVGPNHYVQIVNTSVVVFNKQGTKLLGPISTNTFFANFAAGTSCQNTNDGDGVVRYDRLADRWVISQFSVNGGIGPFFQCIAVSTSPDPTGTYTRYQFSFKDFNDYPKMGLWPDAYYFTYNLFSNNQFAGAQVCAADRVKMIAGNLNATQQCFNTGPNFRALLASDLDGPILPPAGEPNLLLALDTTALDFFKFHVDFAMPANSTFSAPNPTQIPVAAYIPLCNGGTCIKQPNPTQQLASLSDRLMNRLVYRNFGDHEALLVSHAVTAGTGGGVRFYELRLPGACTAANCPTPTIFQQGTFAPDSSFRWMSSMAFDHVGNIAMGYSTSSGTINPSIRYTGRLTSDALGIMGQDEATLFAGAGSQTGGSAWGTYSSMNIDPSDDCTLWYTNEYMNASGPLNWHTRIGNFKFANCGDFSITTNPTSQTVTAGADTTYTINTAATAGIAQTIKLSVTGLPPGVTYALKPDTVTAGMSSMLTLSTSVTTGASITHFTITGAGVETPAVHTAPCSVAVIVHQAPTITITSPTDSSIVSGMVTVSANASGVDGNLVSLVFDLPDGTRIDPLNKGSGLLSTIWNSMTVSDGTGYFIRASAIDDQGAVSVVTVTIAVNNCLNNTFMATDLPPALNEANAIGTSPIQVTGNGRVTSLSVSADITHVSGDNLIVTLVSPLDPIIPPATVISGVDTLAAHITVTNKAISDFFGQAVAGPWKLQVRTLTPGESCTLNSWSISIVGACPQTTHWSQSANPYLPTTENQMGACSELTVAPTTPGGDSSMSKLDIFGSHDENSILRGTLTHNSTTVEAFPTGTLPTGPGTFSFINRAVRGLSNDSSGTWRLCIFDADMLGHTGVLTTWSVHD